MLGGVLCLAQRHLKRLLAYSTIAHLGMFLMAVGVDDAGGLAGGALYLIAHAGTKGALFLLVGVLLNRYGSLDEARLHGRCGHRTPVCWLFLLGGLGLAGLPPFGPGLGKALIEHAGTIVGRPWVPAVLVLVSAATGGAVLRAGLRVFFGVGTPPSTGSERETTDEGPETDEPRGRTPALMLTVITVLLAGGLAVGVLGGLRAAAGRAAVAFLDGTGYLAATGSGHAPPASNAPVATEWTGTGVALGLVSTVLALLVAVVALHGLPAGVRNRIRVLDPVPRALQALHSGHVGDYVAWMFLGLAVLAATLAVSTLG